MFILSRLPQDSDPIQCLACWGNVVRLNLWETLVRVHLWKMRPYVHHRETLYVYVCGKIETFVSCGKTCASLIETLVGLHLRSWET